MSIIIFSRSIRSGKTTELREWCDGRNEVCGILMPDMNSSRKFLNIATGEIFDAECTQPFASKELVEIGKFQFYTSAFQKANNILLASAKTNPQYLVVDEVGKLELNEKGFYPAIKRLLSIYETVENYPFLLLVIRADLLEIIIRKLQIGNFTVIHSLDELP